MKKLFYLLTLFVLMSFTKQKGTETVSLTVKVEHLRNSKGVVQFTLYNKDGSIPDEHFKKFYKKKTAAIENNSAMVTFQNLPKGNYAVNILHDENENGKIDKGFILPKEGIGFSNYNDIGLRNKPKFSKARFELITDKEIDIKIIYM